MASSPFLLLALSFHFSLFCLIPPRMSLTVLIFLHHPSCQTSPPPPVLPLYILPFSSVPHLLFCLFLSTLNSFLCRTSYAVLSDSVLFKPCLLSNSRTCLCSFLHLLLVLSSPCLPPALTPSIHLIHNTSFVPIVGTL